MEPESTAILYTPCSHIVVGASEVSSKSWIPTKVRVGMRLPLKTRGRTEAHANLQMASPIKNAAPLLPMKMTIAVIRASWPGTSVGPSNQSQMIAAVHKPMVISPNRRIMSGINACLLRDLVMDVSAAFS